MGLPRTPLTNAQLQEWVEAVIRELRVVQEHMVVLDQAVERLTDSVLMLEHHPQLEVSSKRDVPEAAPPEWRCWPRARMAHRGWGKR